MQQQKHSSPKLAKKSSNMSSPALMKEKVYLPSRYALDPPKKDSNMHTLLNSIEVNTREQTKFKTSSPQHTSHKDRPKLEIVKKKEASEFTPKPIKREESDMQNFKQIFLDPRQQVLSQIQEKSKSGPLVMAKQVCKDYERLLQFQKGHSPPSKQKQELIQESDLRRHFNEAIELLQRPLTKKTAASFYEEQIRVQPPESPNSSVASTISPGSGYAPSVPLLPSRKGTLAELLMRAKAGMSTEDIEKQAHIAFYLGMAYEQNRKYHSAVRFYKRFLGFAKAMEDKIGMALGANRVAVNLFYDGHVSKSISFHLENLKLSDNENCFAAYYNLGVCHRALNQHDQAVSCLETVLEWSRQRGEPESECITLGQLAVTHRSMEINQQALEYFQKSADICRRLKKIPLLAQNLQQMLLITSLFSLSSPERILDIAIEAYECSKIMESKNRQELHCCNIGLIKGLDEFRENVMGQAMRPEIEECELEGVAEAEEEEEERKEAVRPGSEQPDRGLLADEDKIRQQE